MSGIVSKNNSAAKSTQGTVDGIIAKAKSGVNTLLPPEVRERWWEQSKDFARKNPKLTVSHFYPRKNPKTNVVTRPFS
jgi:hypothetical protein